MSDVNSLFAFPHNCHGAILLFCRFLVVLPSFDVIHSSSDLPRYPWVCLTLSSTHSSSLSLRLGSRRAPAEPLPADYEAFWAEVRRLPRRQAQVVALHYIYDLGIAEIATTLECAEGTVKAHLSRGRTALSSRLGEEPVELS